MTLQNKTALIYGAAGSLGSTIATAFADAGAKVFLAGRTLSKVRKVAESIRANGGKAEAAQVDAMDEKSVNDFVNKVVLDAGSIDITSNAISLDPVQNIPLVEIAVDDFTRPVNIAMRSQFITATVACKVMMKQRSGVILTLTATPGGIGYPLTGGFAPACSAIETFARNLASESGKYGIRVVNIRSGGSPDSAVFKQAQESAPEIMKPILDQMKNDTMLKELPLMADIANVATFLCSPLAAKITGVTVDVTSGTTAALNYRMS
ncbi:MAG TPA: SDR family oxidoreductase [Cyclobacteriaceae bacterium]|nr:SDR family oxidoreductase [Cyclobacteriaceae bacterium]